MKYRHMDCDILVLGAGLSGVTAAVAAARRGASVILLEQNEFPGGTPVIAMHNFICGLSCSRKGLLKETLDQIAPGGKPIKRGKVLILPFRGEKMISGLKRIIRNEDKIKVFYKSRIVSLKMSKKRIVLAIVRDPRGKILIKPKVLIDASGEGDLIKLSGAGYRISALSKRQLSGFSFKVKDIRGDNKSLAWKVPYYLTLGVKSGKLPGYLRFSLFSPAHSKGEGFIRLNLPVTREKNGYKGIEKKAVFIHNYLRKSLPEFKYSCVTQVSPYISNREGIRLLGEYILSKKDILARRKFPDTVAFGNWPIEFWHRENGPSFTYFKKNFNYGIPLRSLKSRNVDNLLATGRCISAEPYVLASTRVLGTCISLGEAAGIAANKLCASF